MIFWDGGGRIPLFEGYAGDFRKRTAEARLCAKHWTPTCVRKYSVEGGKETGHRRGYKSGPVC